MRNKSLTRVLLVLVALRQRRRTLQELATVHRVNPRTIRRDIYALEAAGIPIRHSALEGEGWQAIWWIDPLFTLFDLPPRLASTEPLRAEAQVDDFDLSL